jgi:hypothetical protein
MCSENKEDRKPLDKQNMSIGRIICWSLIGVFVLWALTFFLFFISETEKRGQFGDMFGAVNALFSGLAFAGLIITLILQRQELGLQREELEQTREELKNQRTEFEKENETLKYQRFENLFYNMLNLQQKIVEGLKYSFTEFEDTTIPLAEGGIKKDKREVRREVVGRDVFSFLFNSVPFTAEIKSRYYACSGYREYLKYAGLSAYDNTTIPTYFDHYFRHLFQIVELVDNQDFNTDDSYKYVSLLRSTLSRYEMIWIYYHALQPENRKNKKLVEKYSFLEGIRWHLLALSVEAEHPYDSLWMIEEELEEDGFSDGDFEYYLTDNPNDCDKYYLSAFWSEIEMSKGKQHLDHWREKIENEYSDLIMDLKNKAAQNEKEEE